MGASGGVNVSCFGLVLLGFEIVYWLSAFVLADAIVLDILP